MLPSPHNRGEKLVVAEKVASLALSACWSARAIWINYEPDRESGARSELHQLDEESGSFARSIAYGLLLSAGLVALFVVIWKFVL